MREKEIVNQLLFFVRLAFVILAILPPFVATIGGVLKSPLVLFGGLGMIGIAIATFLFSGVVLSIYTLNVFLRVHPEPVVE